VNGPGKIAIVDVGLLGASAAVQRQLAPGKPAEHRLRNDSMKLLAGSIGVGRADDVHREFQEAVNRNEIHIEGGLRRGVGARRLDRLVLARRMLNRAVKLRGADVNESLEIVAGLELLGQLGERHAIGFEIPPRVLQRGRALALGSEIDDHLRPLAIEELHQEIELVIYVICVIAVTRVAVADAQCEAFVFR
jgi:hypothetical protein